MIRKVGEVFRVKVKEKITLVKREGDELGPYILEPGEYEFKKIKLPNGIVRIVLVHKQEIFLSEDLFRFYYHPNHGRLGTQIDILF
ncbi:MAG: hypothetical protein U5L76_05365 [Patescibacteria group bacterium]|nr:hypothetical protein [Patescibacteria group bacterium]